MPKIRWQEQIKHKQLFHVLKDHSTVLFKIFPCHSRCQFACSQKSACNCMSPKVITFNSKFHQINKLIYVSLLGFKKTSLMVRDMQGERLKGTAVTAKERQGTSLANNFAIMMLSEATEKKNIFGIKGPRELRMILSLHLTSLPC